MPLNLCQGSSSTEEGKGGAIIHHFKSINIAETPVAPIVDEAQGICGLPDGRLAVATSDGKILVWDAALQNVVLLLSRKTGADSYPSGTTCLHPLDSKHLASIDERGVVLVWNLENALQLSNALIRDLRASCLKDRQFEYTRKDGIVPSDGAGSSAACIVRYEASPPLGSHMSGWFSASVAGEGRVAMINPNCTAIHVRVYAAPSAQ